MEVGENTEGDYRNRNQNIRKYNSLKLLLHVLPEIEAVFLNMLKKEASDKKEHNRSDSFLGIKDGSEDIMRNRVRIPVQSIASRMNADDKENGYAPKVMNVCQKFGHRRSVRPERFVSSTLCV